MLPGVVLNTECYQGRAKYRVLPGECHQGSATECYQWSAKYRVLPGECYLQSATKGSTTRGVPPVRYNQGGTTRECF